MSLACGRLVHFRSAEPDKRHPRLDGYENINVTSGNVRWRSLSPMLLGPGTVREPRLATEDYPDGIVPGSVAVGDTERELTFSNIENLWQYSKFYTFDLDSAGQLTSSFFTRRARGLADPKPHRRALPKRMGQPVGAYWAGQHCTYIQSRYYYCLHYSRLVVATDAYRTLQAKLAQGQNLHIIGYDGRAIEMSQSSLQRQYDSPEAPFGHELVLCALLSGWAPWLH